MKLVTPTNIRLPMLQMMVRIIIRIRQNIRISVIQSFWPMRHVRTVPLMVGTETQTLQAAK